MPEDPWITIVGLGEDGLAGLSDASRIAIEQAEVIMGPPRHLGLLPETAATQVPWPVPFSDGIALLGGYEGRRVVVLVSGNPFWFGAGSVIAKTFGKGSWRALPAPSTFAHVAARLGWPLETTLCLGLHAAPLTRLRPHLACGQRMIVLLRDGAAVSDLMTYLKETGFAKSRVTVFEALNGPCERMTEVSGKETPSDFEAPVCAAIEVQGAGLAVPNVSGLPDALFETDGVMTKRPMRALTLSALAPKPGERLWDIGAGSGSISIEWLLAHPTCEATAIETRADRTALIRQNAETLGVDRLQLVEGAAPDALEGLPDPDAVFVGGGLSMELIAALRARLAKGTRIVANGVTLESEALLSRLHAEIGGSLMRIDIANAAPMGAKTGWKASYPVVQWSAVL